jgi:type I restriction enzyme S subunit
MKQDWEIKKLGDVGRVSMCKRILKKQTSQIGDIPFYKIGTFGKFPNAFISKEVYEEYRSKYSFPKKGDILLSASGTIGRRVIYDGKPAYFQDSNIVWIDNDEKKVLNEYLYKFYGFCNWNPSKGATISRLYNDDLRKIPIPIPPLPEQKCIVAILDKAFAAVANAKSSAEQNLKNAKEFFESYLQGVFENKGEGWEEKAFGKILAEPPKNGWSPPAKYHSDSGVPVLTLSAVTGFIFNSNCVKHTTAPIKDDALYWINNGDLLITRSNTPELVGHVAICKDLINKTIYPDLMMKINPDVSIVITKFLYYQLRSPQLRSIIKDSAHGANPTMKKINKQDVQNFKISYPSLSEQKSIVKKLDTLSSETKKLEAIYQQKTENLEEMKKSVLQKAFNGEL